MTTGASEPVPRNTVPMPPATISIPAEAEEYFPIRHKDWQRIRDLVGTVADPRRWVSQVGWTAVGVGFTAGLGIIPWEAARSQISADSYAWFTPTLLLLAIFSFLLAGVCWLFSRTVKEMTDASRAKICADMDAVYAPHRSTS